MLLDRTDVAARLQLRDYIAIVEEAFVLHARGGTLRPGILHIDTRAGEFHLKTAGLEAERSYVGLKLNGGFFDNHDRFGMPCIQGTIILCDGDNGYPLALMDSAEITVQRTGATTAIAAKHLAPADSRVVTVCGCGTQGRGQLRSLAHVLPLEGAYAYDIDAKRADAFAAEMSEALGLAVSRVDDLGEAVGSSQVCVTCTPAREPFLGPEHIRPGMFVAAIGADSPDKQELQPELLAASSLVVDLVEQCAEVGELHHAIEAGLMGADDVYAELGEIVAGKKPGRSSVEQTFVFDATGTGLQDVAAAVRIYECAADLPATSRFDFFG